MRFVYMQAREKKQTVGQHPLNNFIWQNSIMVIVIIIIFILYRFCFFDIKSNVVIFLCHIIKL